MKLRTSAFTEFLFWFILVLYVFTYEKIRLKLKSTPTIMAEGELKVWFGFLSFIAEFDFLI